MKQLMAFFLFITIVLSFTASAHAGWLLYHKPEFKGKVIDAETKEPIEGAVVVVIYNKHTLISGPGGGYSSVIKVKEILTDKNGEFHFPSYTTLIQPNSIEDTAEFIIYKAGYGSYPDLQTSPPGVVDPEKLFSKDYGTSESVQIDYKTITYTLGIVELPKLKTRYERLRAIPATPTDYRSKELPLLYKAMNEENKRFGLGEEK
jgi:hypothetical protein